MSRASSTLGIELKCGLCPKRPTFSDVSHLLTHISSKSHLAHRFKLQIRSNGEQNARRQLEDFDFWYHSNNLDGLLADRMNAKEQKKNNKEKKARKSSVVQPKREKLKEEKEAVFEENTLAQTPLYRAPVPRMWPTSENLMGTDSLIDWDQSAYETPTAQRDIPGFARQQSPDNNNLDPKLITPWKDLQGNDETKVEEKLTDSANKLKGVHWPGMDIFDSATPEMKRMRNQRKDSNVIEVMKATSAGVEPAEISYHANGEFRGSRDIFGSLSPIPSPLLEEKIPSVKKRKPRKATLKTKSANIPQAQNRTRASKYKKNSVGPARRAPSPAQERGFTNGLFQKPIPTLNPLALSLGRKFGAVEEEDDEFILDLNAMGGKKRSFKIFHDAPEHSPGQTESPLEERRFDFPTHALQPYGDSSSSSGIVQQSPTPVPRSSIFRASGKENGQPEMLSRRPYHNHSNNSLYSAQMLYENPINPLFNQAYSSRSFSFGETQHHYSGDSAAYAPSYQLSLPLGRRHRSDAPSPAPRLRDHNIPTNGYGA